MPPGIHPRTVYVVGYPGAGKTSAVRVALTGLVAQPQEGCVPFVTYRRPGQQRYVAAQLGRLRAGGFGGTDALSMSIQPRAVAWLREAPYELIVAEGDRLANDAFLATAAERGPLTVVLIEVPAEVARARGAARAEALGREPQSESWWAGRRTKVDGVAQRWSALRIDGTQLRPAVGAQLREAMRL